MTTIYGGYMGSWFGIWVTKNDMNRDGLEDLILGSWGTTTGAGDSGGEIYVFLNKGTNKDIIIPKMIKLFMPFPNPFSNQISFKFDMISSEFVQVNVYDITGRVVRNLLSTYMEAGEHWANWNGLNDQNGKIPSGLYFIALQDNKQTYIKKVIYLKNR